MKRTAAYSMSFACLFLLSGCFKKPYDAYKTSYKTAGAQKYVDESVDQQVATKKNIKYMTLPEARAARVYYEDRNEVEIIEKALMHIIKLSDNYQEKADCLYEMATIQLSLGRLEKARELFDQLIREYPGAPSKREAAYRRILAYYWDCRDAQRDQDITETTLKLTQDFNKEWPNHPDYADNLVAIQDYCYRLLFDADILRMNFYISKYQIFNEADSLKAAQLRLAYILQQLLEPQKHLESADKDSIIEVYERIKELEESELDARYKLLLKASALLVGNKHED